MDRDQDGEGSRQTEIKMDRIKMWRDQDGKGSRWTEIKMNLDYSTDQFQERQGLEYMRAVDNDGHG